MREQDELQDRCMAYVMLRVTLGVDFLGHGFIRLFHGDALFAQGMAKQMADTPMPAWFVHDFGLVLPPIELALGLLLVLGLFTRWSLVAGAGLMMALMVGITLKQDWATAGTQLVYSLVFFILLYARAGNDATWPDLLRTRSIRSLD